MSTGIVSGILAALFTPLILRLLTSPASPPQKIGDSEVAEYGLGMRGLMLLGMVFFSALSILPVLYPGKTPATQLPWIVAFFATFSLLCVLALVLMFRSRLLWNKEGFCGSDLLGRRHQIAWCQVESATYWGSFQGVQIIGPNGARVWIYDLMNGCEAFYQELGYQANLRGFRCDVPRLNSPPQDGGDEG